MPQRLRHLCLALTGAVAVTACGPQVARTPPAEAEPEPRNVIFFIVDGMGAAQAKAYRAYADDPDTHVIEPLPFDAFLVGAVATESLELRCDESEPPICERLPYAVTDSAASATAYAAGRDTLNGMVGQGPDGERFTSVLELAAANGKGTGVVSTSQVTHASPAAFVAHAPSRRDYPAIADQFFDNQVDGRPLAQVILGGGMQDFRREDRDVAADLVNQAGYELLTDRGALEAADGDRLLGLFAPVGLPRHWDRPDAAPTLADMTRKAIDVLSRNDDGFFLMVEGSQVDWAAHGNDIAGVVSEMESLTEAAAVALDYAAARDDTLVVITADHETGGLSLGRDGRYEWDPSALRALDATPAKMVEVFVAGDRPLSAVVADHVRFTLTEAERAALDAPGADVNMAYGAITGLLDARTHTGWTTSGHTGVDVPLYATGPGSEAFRGVMQNEAVGRALIGAVTR